MKIRRITALIVAVLMLAAVFCACKPSEEPKAYTRGKTEGKTYHSDFADLTFTIPDDNWLFSTDEEIAAMMGIGAEALAKDGDSFDVSKVTSTVEFQAMSMGGSNVVMTVEKQNALSVALNSMDDYIKYIKDAMTDQVKNSGYTYTFGEDKDVTLGSHTFRRLDATLTVNGIEIEQAICIRFEGKYLVNITMTETAGDVDIETMQGMIS